MTINILNKEYEVIILKKLGQKNTYIRVKPDYKILVTTSKFQTKRYINNLINDNIKRLEQMAINQEKKMNNNTGFNYLGKNYNIVYKNVKSIIFDDENVYMSEDFDIDKWYKSKAKVIFLEHLDNIYNKFSREIPYPKLRIRKMKTRWGVCNIKTKIVTLNLELIKRDFKYLDYVIVHELSHLIYGDHSSSFWDLVFENDKDYKQIRKEMKEF